MLRHVREKVLQRDRLVERCWRRFSALIVWRSLHQRVELFARVPGFTPLAQVFLRQDYLTNTLGDAGEAARAILGILLALPVRVVVADYDDIPATSRPRRDCRSRCSRAWLQFRSLSRPHS